MGLSRGGIDPPKETKDLLAEIGTVLAVNTTHRVSKHMEHSKRGDCNVNTDSYVEVFPDLNNDPRSLYTA